MNAPLDRLYEWASAHIPNAFRVVLIPVAALSDPRRCWRHAPYFSAASAAS